MLRKAAFVVGFGAGFLVGSYMGREPYEKVQAKVTGVVEDPEVRRKVQEGAEKAAATVKEQAPVVGEKAADAAKSATAKAKESAGNAADAAKDKADQASKSKSGDATDNLDGASKDAGAPKPGPGPVQPTPGSTS
ncbi:MULTISPECIES: hypothetical protein [Kocuria]|uniref:YtxH domain-containing protein n=1 Tax=Kocuria subflava TaxID=1736139 RepID=A0A846TT35_9MICC|nr:MULTISPECIES: hypothetical protein [Kocuria]NKE08942.1 hypothetical protein [Kocuria subflava]